MEGTSSKEETAKKIVLQQINNLFANPAHIKQNECAACNILFSLADAMQLYESDAGNLSLEYCQLI
jgi:hypothetical protein